MSKDKQFISKNDTKLAQDAHFTFFVEKKSSLRKNRKRYPVFDYERRNIYKFNAFTIKNDFENLSENAEFRVENSHKRIVYNRGIRISDVFWDLVWDK